MGQHPDPVGAIRDRFGARTVFVLPAQMFGAFRRQLDTATGVELAFETDRGMRIYRLPPAAGDR